MQFSTAKSLCADGMSTETVRSRMVDLRSLFQFLLIVIVHHKLKLAALYYLGITTSIENHYIVKTAPLSVQFFFSLISLWLFFCILTSKTWKRGGRRLFICHWKELWNNKSVIFSNSVIRNKKRNSKKLFFYTWVTIVQQLIWH